MKKPLKIYSHSSPFEKYLPTPRSSTPCLYMTSWLHMQMKLKVRDKTRRALSHLLSSSKRDAVDYFLITKATTVMRGSPLLSYPSPRLASFNLSAMAQVKKFSPIPNPIGIGRWRWMDLKRGARRGDDVPKVLSMQMTGQTTYRYNGNNNSNNNNNNSYVVIFTGTQTHTYTDT